MATLTPAALADLEKDVANGNSLDSELRRRGLTRADYDRARGVGTNAPGGGVPLPTRAPQADGRAPLPSAVGPGPTATAAVQPIRGAPTPTQTATVQPIRGAPTPAPAAAPPYGGTPTSSQTLAPTPSIPQTYTGQAPDWALFQRDPAAYAAWQANQARVAAAVSGGQIATPSGAQAGGGPRMPATVQQQQRFAITAQTRADLESDVAAGNDLDSELARRGWSRAEMGYAPAPVAAPVPAPAPVAAPVAAPAPAPTAQPQPMAPNTQPMTQPQADSAYQQAYAQWQRDYAAWDQAHGDNWRQQQAQQPSFGQQPQQPGSPLGQPLQGGYYSDASRGNPQPGMSYAQVITPMGGQLGGMQPGFYQTAPSAANGWVGRRSEEAGMAPGQVWNGQAWAPAGQQPGLQAPAGGPQPGQTGGLNFHVLNTQGQPAYGDWGKALAQRPQSAPAPGLASIEQQASALGPLNKLSPRAYYGADPSGQNYVNSAYMHAGEAGDEADIRYAAQKALPRASARGIPSFGRLGAF